MLTVAPIQEEVKAKASSNDASFFASMLVATAAVTTATGTTNQVASAAAPHVKKAAAQRYSGRPDAMSTMYGDAKTAASVGAAVANNPAGEISRAESASAYPPASIHHTHLRHRCLHHSQGARLGYVFGRSRWREGGESARREERQRHVDLALGDAGRINDGVQQPAAAAAAAALRAKHDFRGRRLRIR